MRWHAQVAHVMRKDLYRSRWLLLAYTMVVLGVTAAAVGWRAFGAGSAPLGTLFLILLGMILVALLVQADSPRGSTAFWVTLPLHRSAVFTAKVAGAILFLLVLPLVGQFAGLWAHAVAAGDLPVLLGRSALTYGAWLGFAAVVAALTPDLRTFAAGLVLVVVGGAVGMETLGSWLHPARAPLSPDPLPWPVTVVGGALLVLAHQYRTRNVVRGAWIATLLGIAVVVLPVTAGRAAPAVRPASSSIPDPLRPAKLAVRNVRVDQGDETTLELQLSGVSASHQYLLVSPVVHLQRPNGSPVRVEIQSGRNASISLNAPIPGMDETLTWLGERVPPQNFLTTVRVDLLPEQREAVARGDARLTVRGHLEVREARVQADLPLEVGAMAIFAGRRTRVLEVENTGEGASVGLQASSVASPRFSEATTQMHMPAQRSIMYALVNQYAHEAVALSERRSSGSNFALVLPGPQTWTETHSLQQDPMVSRVRVGDDWLRHARLVLLDWVPVGSDPFLIQTAPPGAILRRARVDVAR